MEKFYSICMVITLVSFLGFCVENVWLAITKGYIDNRNMCLPFLLGYGLTVATIYLLFGTPTDLRIFAFALQIGSGYLNTLIYFLIVCVCVMLGEWILGTFIEKTTGIIWWNYEELPLHITKYTSIPTTMAFATMITLFMRYFFGPLCAKFTEVQNPVFGISVTILMLIMTVDFIHSGIRMFRTHELMKIWHIELKFLLKCACKSGLKINTQYMKKRMENGCDKE